MGRSSTRGRVARVVASIALGLGAFGVLGAGFVHATDDTQWGQRPGSHQLLIDDSSSTPTFTTFDTQWG